jgi:hypothetical protein
MLEKANMSRKGGATERLDVQDGGRRLTVAAAAAVTRAYSSDLGRGDQREKGFSYLIYFHCRNKCRSIPIIK